MEIYQQKLDKYYMLYVFVTFLTALSISFIAIYYSVAGLVAIFAAAPIPIIVMGGVLEISKLVTAVWLHKFWTKAVWWLKGYLTVAVGVLMLITSMGIFGFLSKAHIEQTSASEESVAQEQRISNEIIRYEDAIRKSEATIAKLEEKGTGGQAVIQLQIDKEQERIDAAYARIQPLVDEQNNIIKSATQLYQTELDKIDKNLALLQTFINNGEIAKAQGMVGTKADGKYGPNTASAFTAYQDQKAAERQGWLDKIQNASDTDTVKQAKEEITRLRTQAEKQIEESNKLITSYRAQLQNTEAKDVSSLLAAEQDKIKANNQELDLLLQEKFALQADVRKLEAEVGPIKYIAEFVYGNEADAGLLEKAVKWVIIIIIFVFDPLAVLLLIASQYTINYISTNESKENSRIKFKNPIQIPTIFKNFAFKKDDIEYAKLYVQDKTEENKINDRYLELIDFESQAAYKKAKTKWKERYPSEDLKSYKQAYLEGNIDELPWKSLMIDK